MTSYNTFNNYCRERSLHRRVISAPISTPKFEGVSSVAGATTEILQNARSAVQSRLFGRTEIASEGGEKSLQPFNILGLIPQQEFEIGATNFSASGEPCSANGNVISRVEDRLKAPMLRAVTSMSVVTTNRPPAFTGPAPSVVPQPHPVASAAASSSITRHNPRPFYICNDATNDGFPRYATLDRVQRLGDGAITLVISCREGGLEVCEVGASTVRPLISLVDIKSVIPKNASFFHAFATPLLSTTPDATTCREVLQLETNILQGQDGSRLHRDDAYKQQILKLLGGHASSHPRVAPHSIPNYLQRHLADIASQEDFNEGLKVLDACIIEESIEEENPICIETTDAGGISAEAEEDGFGVIEAHDSDKGSRSGSDNEPAEKAVSLSEIRARDISGLTRGVRQTKKTRTDVVERSDDIVPCLLHEDVEGWRGYRNPTHMCTIALVTEPYRVKQPSNAPYATEVLRTAISPPPFPEEGRTTADSKKGAWWAQTVLVVRCSTVLAAKEATELRSKLVDAGYAASFIQSALDPTPPMSAAPPASGHKRVIDMAPYLSHRVIPATGLREGSQDGLRTRLDPIPLPPTKDSHDAAYLRIVKNHINESGILLEVEREHTFQIVPAVGIESAPLPVITAIKAAPRVVREVHVSHTLHNCKGRFVTRNARRPVVVFGGQIILTTAASYNKFGNQTDSEEERRRARPRPTSPAPNVPSDLLSERIIVLTPTAVGGGTDRTSYEYHSGLQVSQEIPAAAVGAQWSHLMSAKIKELSAKSGGFESLQLRESAVIGKILGEPLRHGLPRAAKRPSAIVSQGMEFGRTTVDSHTNAYITFLSESCAKVIVECLPTSWKTTLCGVGGLGRSSAYEASPGSSASSTAPPCPIHPIPAAATVSIAAGLLAFSGAPFQPSPQPPTLSAVLASAFKIAGLPHCSNEGLIASAAPRQRQHEASAPASAPVFSFLLECIQSNPAQFAPESQQDKCIRLVRQWIEIESNVNQLVTLMGQPPAEMDLTHRKNRVTPAFILFVVHSLTEILLAHEREAGIADPLQEENRRHSSLFHLAGGVVPRYPSPQYAASVRKGDVGGESGPRAWLDLIEGIDGAVSTSVNILLSALKFRCDIASIVHSDAKPILPASEDLEQQSERVLRMMSAVSSIVMGEQRDKIPNYNTATAAVGHPSNDRGVVTLMYLPQAEGGDGVLGPAGVLSIPLDGDAFAVSDDIQLISFSRDGRLMAVATTDSVNVTVFRVGVRAIQFPARAKVPEGEQEEAPPNDVQAAPAARMPLEFTPAFTLRRGHFRSQLSAIQFSPLGTCVSLLSAGSGAIHIYLLADSNNHVVAPNPSTVCKVEAREGPPIKIFNGDSNDAERALRELCRRMGGNRPDLLRWPFPIIAFVEEKLHSSLPANRTGTNLDPSRLTIGVISAAGNSIAFGTLTERGTPAALHWSATSQSPLNLSATTRGYVGWGVDLTPPTVVYPLEGGNESLDNVSLPSNAIPALMSLRSQWRQAYHRVSKPVPPEGGTGGPSDAVKAIKHQDYNFDVATRRYLTVQELGMARRFLFPRVFNFEQTIVAAASGQTNLSDFYNDNARVAVPESVENLALSDEILEQIGYARPHPTSPSVNGSGPTSPAAAQPRRPQRLLAAPARPQTNNGTLPSVNSINSIDSVDFGRFAQQAREQWATLETRRDNPSQESLSSPTWQNISMHTNQSFNVEDVRVDDVE